MKRSFVVRFEELEEARLYAESCTSTNYIVSSLYKFRQDEAYYLSVQHSVLPDRVYEGVKTLASEFGEVVTLQPAARQFLFENSEVIIEDGAIQILKGI